MNENLEELEKAVLKNIEDFKELENIQKNQNNQYEFMQKEDDNYDLTNLSNLEKNNNSFLKKPNNSELTIYTKDEMNLIDSNKTFEKISIVVKELIENSIDAKAKNISVFIQNGGLDKIEITDDGIGIPLENLINLCKRYTTTKASEYDYNMKNLKTLGYRGEALSILSYNSNIKIISKFEKSQIGYEVVYKNGSAFLINYNKRSTLKKLNQKKKSYTNDNKKDNSFDAEDLCGKRSDNFKETYQNKSIKKNEFSEENTKCIEDYCKVVNCPIGTTIIIEQLFYNNLIRRKSMEQSIELKEIIDLIAKFSLHFHKIDFSFSNNSLINKIINTKLTKAQIKNQTKDLELNFNANDTIMNNGKNENNSELLLFIKKQLISKLFSSEVSENLFHFSDLDLEKAGFIGEETKDLLNEELISNKANNGFLKKFKFNAYFTKPSANLNKNNFILFVNDRLVYMPTLLNLLEQIYSKFLIKHGKFFGYIDLKCSESDIDYNVKANKSQVFIREEKKFFEFFAYILEKQLSEEISSKNYHVSEYNNFYRNSQNKKNIAFSNTLHTSQLNDNFYYAKDKVRVDNKTIDINKFLKHKIIMNTKNQNKLNEYLINDENEYLNSEENSYDDDQDYEKNKNNFKQKEKIEVLKKHDNNKSMENTIDLEDEVSIRISNLISKKFYSEENTNNYLTEIIRNCFYIGFEEKKSLAFIQYETSLFLINLEFLFYEVILYKLITNKGFNSQKIKLDSNFELFNLISMVEENFEGELNYVKSENTKFCKNTNNSIFPILEKNFKLDEKLKILERILGQFISIKYNEKNSIKEILIVDLFEGKIPFEKFLRKIPFLNYSFLKEIFDKNEKEKNSIFNNKANNNINNNNLYDNLNIDAYYLSHVFEFIKIYVFYLSKFYIDYFSSENNREENDLLLKSFLFTEIQKNGFLIRKNVKADMFIEKLIDTETLYTVFERC